MSSEEFPYPFIKGAQVLVGRDVWVTLCCRVASLPGVGQIWHTTGDIIVISSVNVSGQLEWSVIDQPHAFLKHESVRPLLRFASSSDHLS